MTHKKHYVIPRMTAVLTANTLLQSGSPASAPAVTLGTGSVNADVVEVKDNTQNYDVWDDDWNQ